MECLWIFANDWHLRLQRRIFKLLIGESSLPCTSVMKNSMKMPEMSPLRSGSARRSSLEASSLLHASVLKNLADNLYEKRKAAALQVQEVLKSLISSREHEKIMAIISLLTNDFIQSPQANYRMGGLLGLAAVAVGLSSEAVRYLDYIVPPVIKASKDQDNRVRYFACEALYNIAQVSRGDLIIFFNSIFDALCNLSADSNSNVQSAAHLLDGLIKDIATRSDQFSIEEFIPELRKRMNVLNPFVRQFLMGWITALDTVPDIDILGFLPDFLDGLFNMLSDSSHEIRQQADFALSEFLEEIRNSSVVDYKRMVEILVRRAQSPDEFTCLTAITWIREFVKLGGDQLAPYCAELLGAILSSISSKGEKIKAVARETNKELQAIKAGPGIAPMLDVAQKGLESEHEMTRLEALRWMLLLLERHRIEFLSFLDVTFPVLLQLLSDESDDVVLLVLEVQACIAKDPQQFRHLMVFLTRKFQTDRSLLKRRGILILRRLCVLLNAENVYRQLAIILEGEADLEFATIMVQALNIILLTAVELKDLRACLKQSLSNAEGRDLFVALYSSWCHSPMATISLCFLAQAYQHTTEVIQSLGESDIDAEFLVQIDKLVRLLETPIFTYLRLQLLEPGIYPELLKALYGLLMLLPQQSEAFKILRTRLKTLPTSAFMQIQSAMDAGFSAQGRRRDGSNKVLDVSGINFAMRLQQFEYMQQQHRLHQDQNL